MKRYTVVINIVIMLVFLSFISNATSITIKEKNEAIEPVDKPYTYYFPLAKITSSKDLCVKGAIINEFPAYMNIIIVDGDDKNNNPVGILEGKIIVDTEHYGEIEIGTGCDISFTFSGGISMKPIEHIGWYEITNVDGWGNSIRIKSPEQLQRSRAVGNNHHIINMIQKILHKPIFNFSLF